MLEYNHRNESGEPNGVTITTGLSGSYCQRAPPAKKLRLTPELELVKKLSLRASAHTGVAIRSSKCSDFNGSL